MYYNISGKIVQQQTCDHTHKGTQHGTLITMLVNPSSSYTAVKQVAQEKEKGYQCSEGILYISGITEECYLQRSLKLAINGRQEADEEIYEGEKNKWSYTVMTQLTL